MVTKGQLVPPQAPAQYVVTNICQQKTHTVPRRSDSILEHGGATLLSAALLPGHHRVAPLVRGVDRHRGTPGTIVRSAPARHHPTGNLMPLRDEEPTDTWALNRCQLPQARDEE